MQLRCISQKQLTTKMIHGVKVEKETKGKHGVIKWLSNLMVVYL